MTSQILAPNEYFSRIERLENNAILIDVRTPAEYEESHLPNAINIPISELPQKREMLKQYNTIFLYCHSGGRSQLAVSLLDNLEEVTIVDLDGGISAWSEEELPLMRT